MTNSTFLPALVLGVLVGWLARSLVTDPTISAGSVLITIVSLCVGWWIQRTVRRQAELDRVPIESIGKLCDRIDELIVKCLDVAMSAQPTDPALLQPLRLLHNEVAWLGTVARALDTSTAEQARLWDKYVTFKTWLTGGSTVDVNSAAKVGRGMRTCCLQIRWQLCKRVLDRPGDIGMLAGSE